MSSSALKQIATGAHVATGKPSDPVMAALTGAMSKIANVLPSLITPERMLRIVTNELRLNPKLAAAAKANPASLVNAVCVAARCGLEIGGPNPQGHLVPHGNEVVFYPDYRGQLALMRRSGELASFTLELVYEKDVFDLELGFRTEVKHVPFLDGDRGAAKLGYFAATLSNGERMFIWMSKQQIDKIKAKSRASSSGPWVNDWEEMAKKTVVHRAAKLMPSSVESRIAAAAADVVDAGGAPKLSLDDPNTIDMAAAYGVEAETGEITNGAAADDGPIDVGTATTAPPVRSYAVLADLLQKATSLADRALLLDEGRGLSGQQYEELCALAQRLEGGK